MINKERGGFTLIEILIVVAIIAILASIVLVGLGPTQQSGRDARRLSDLHEDQNALELYYAKCGGYPGGVSCAATLATAAKFDNSTDATTYGAIATVLTTSGIGVTAIPQDPTTGNSYYYAVPSATTLNTTYVIGAKLENTNNAAFTNYQPPTPGANGDGAAGGGLTSCASPYYCLTL